MEIEFKIIEEPEKIMSCTIKNSSGQTVNTKLTHIRINHLLTKKDYRVDWLLNTLGYDFYYYRWKLKEKDYRENICNILEGSPIGASKHVYKQLMIALKPYQEYLNKLRTGWRGKERTRWLPQIIKHWDTIAQLEQDTLKNLVPIILYGEGNPKELKNKLGKSVWKALHHNSFSRNRLMIETGRNLEDIINLPSTILSKINKRSQVSHKELAKCIIRSKRIGVPYKYWTRDTMQLYEDTVRMSVKVKGKAEYPLNAKQMNKKHEEYTYLITSRKYSPKPIVDDIRIEIEGYEITPLISPLQIRSEGEKMHHCVGSYVDDVARGDCYLYHIKNKKTLDESTIELRKGGNTWEINQHRGYCNGNTENREIEGQILHLYRSGRKDNTVPEQENRLNRLEILGGDDDDWFDEA